MRPVNARGPPRVRGAGLVRPAEVEPGEPGSCVCYFTETSSMRKTVGSETSVVPRNWIRTVCPL